MTLLIDVANLLGAGSGELAGVRDVALRLPSGASAAVLAVLLACGLAVGIASYARTREPIRRGKRVAFAAARFLVYLLLAVVLSGLVLHVEYSVAEKPRALVLVDDSLSMTAPVSGSLPRIGQRLDEVRAVFGKALPELESKRRVRVCLFDGRELRGEAFGELEAQASRTDIPGVLDAFLRQPEAAGLREVFLLSDGRNTARANYRAAAVALRERGIRLYALLAGDAAEFKDVRIGAASTAPFCRAFDRVAVSYTVHHQNCAGETARIEVFDADKPDAILSRADLPLTAGAGGRHGRLVLEPPVRNGELRLVVRVSGVAGDMVEGNNKATLHTRIVEEPIKVLYIENFPRAEFKFVKQSLGRDPNIALTTLNRMPGGSWLVQGPCLLENPGNGFPSEIGELLKYDVLVLGSISLGYFSADDRFEERKLSNIAQFVSGRGGGLIVLAGSRSYGHGQYQGSPLEPLLPFELLEPGQEPYLAEEIRAELTAAGRFHPVVQLADSVGENAALWPTMPELMGCNVVGPPRPGAETLLVCSKEIDGRKPVLLACRQYGFGRVLAATTYSTFRWRLGVPHEKGNLLARFWCQAVRYVAPDPRLLPGALNIQLDRSWYTRGDTARVLVRPLDPYYAPVQNQTMRLSVRAPDKTEFQAILPEDPGRKGTYPAAILLEQAGDYELLADNGRGQESRLALTAELGSREFLDVRADGAELDALARGSGGELMPLTRAADLFQRLDRAPVIVAREADIAFRDLPVMLFLLLALCVGEWFFRKRSGLA